MEKEINIAETEWKVMEPLWETPGQTIGEIRAALADTDWSDSTIKTLVRRLTKKGILGVDDSGEQFRYYPVYSQSECRLRETRHLIDRIYNGSVKLLMTNLVSDSNLTDEDAEKLMELIDKMEGGERP